MACTTDSQCTSRIPQGAHAGERCIANMCQHTHDPLALDASGLQPVVDRFAAHGINLHLLRGHAQPHSHVISYRQLQFFENLCEGASLASATAGLGKYAEILYDIKPRSTPDRFNIAYHYAFFGHYVGCATAEHCAPTRPFCPTTSSRRCSCMNSVTIWDCTTMAISTISARIKRAAALRTFALT
jgi:hypothetical protein